jgi:hypothetical protein
MPVKFAVIFRINKSHEYSQPPDTRQFPENGFQNGGFSDLPGKVKSIVRAEVIASPENVFHKNAGLNKILVRPHNSPESEKTFTSRVRCGIFSIRSSIAGVRPRRISPGTRIAFSVAESGSGGEIVAFRIRGIAGCFFHIEYLFRSIYLIFIILCLAGLFSYSDIR